MWGMLGDIRFELLRAPESADLTIKHNYAEHAVIEGKPKIQWTGDALRERNWTIRLHYTFCDPDAVIAAIRAMAARHEALPLSLGTGEYLGRYIVTDINEVSTVTDAIGSTWAMTAALKLKEWVGTAASDTGEAVAGSGQTLVGSVWS
jgi:phage protein U